MLPPMARFVCNLREKPFIFCQKLHWEFCLYFLPVFSYSSAQNVHSPAETEANELFRSCGTRRRAAFSKVEPVSHCLNRCPRPNLPTTKFPLLYSIEEPRDHVTFMWRPLPLFFPIFSSESGASPEEFSCASHRKSQSHFHCCDLFVCCRHYISDAKAPWLHSNNTRHFLECIFVPE